MSNEPLGNLFNRAFETWLGEGLTPLIENAVFTKIDDPDNRAVYRYQIDFPLDVILPNPETREAIIKQYCKVFGEITNRLEVQASELIPGIRIDATFEEDVQDLLRAMLTSAFTGKDNYAHYLRNVDDLGGEDAWLKVSQNIDEWARQLDTCVYITFEAFINRPQEVATPALMWFIITEGYKKKEGGLPGQMIKVEALETNWDYEGGKPNLDNEGEDNGE